jgi:tRNA-dihydrouridine synthase 3
MWAEPGTEPECKWTNCKYIHDLKSYVESKPEDIGAECYVFSSLGYCPRGVTCRFAGHHTDKDFKNVKNKEIYTEKPQESNQLSKDIATKLRKKEYDFKLAETAIELSFDIWRKNNPDVIIDGRDDNPKENKTNEPATKKAKLEKPIGYAPEEDLIKLRPQEKKKLDFKDKLYLAPLTTVGNLPYRRLCKKLGADITCSEMALGLPLLQGHGPEWALVQRHHSEDFFGVQVCGCSPNQMSKVAQLLEENVDCDFVDINMGCPIDLVFKKGMGSGLMPRNRSVETISRTMASIMSRPLTIKMRTGLYKDKNIAHNIFPRLEDYGVAALTIHGRSREQRYTKLADWDYIAECKKTVNIPVFGNGDVLNYEDYIAKKESSGVDGIMIARGALIKPWIFTEIKEQRHWDISAQERLDIFKDFANFGMEHWGSDDRGLETTRKFLLEWLSFTYRYVPFGILKNPPQRINERLPIFKGRNELETLLSSPNSQDWVKITEMFLGKVKDGFEFVPRHKANSYS